MDIDDLAPNNFAARLASEGGRAFLVYDPEHRRVVTSAAWLAPLATFLEGDRRDFAEHEGVFFATSPTTGALFGAFVHRTIRGQAAGGLRHWPYARVVDFVRDGLRLSRGMTRKNALAGLWWGGGKGIIARPEGDAWKNEEVRRRLYREYGEFVTSLRGCYVTAEDVGTRPDDLAEVHTTTRYAISIPEIVGGSGNPSPATAKGVVCAMEAALAFHGRGDLAGKTVAMQGAGNVATYMIEDLLEKGIGKITATELDDDRRTMLTERFRGAPVEFRASTPDDLSVFAEPCDILCPNALGGVLGPHTIDKIATRIVCGAANNQLLDDRRDDAALAARGITWVPDFVANRMGIVNCANEQYGHLPDDPAIARHFSRDHAESVFQVTTRVLERAQRDNITTARAANDLADEASLVPHPMWGHRGRAIISGLLATGWAAAR